MWHRNSILYFFVISLVHLGANAQEVGFDPQIPRIWDDKVMQELELPLVNSKFSPKHVSAKFYYQMPPRVLLKTYPVYHPDKEPPGYIGRLKTLEPEAIWDKSSLRTKADWIRAGELVFDAPLITRFLSPSSRDYEASLPIRQKRWFEETGTPVAADGTVPFFRYVIEEKGVVRIGALSCAMCHSRVMPDGTVVKGGQGNFPFDRAFAYDIRHGGGQIDHVRALHQMLYSASWVRPEEQARISKMSIEEFAEWHHPLPPGVLARTRTSPDIPVRIPDLFELKDRAYLDATGLQRHRDIADLMRYASLNQQIDDLSSFGEFVPFEQFFKLPPPEHLTNLRHSDEQLYALAMFVYSLEPPRNPNRMDELAMRGKRVFEREDCGRCHTPPIYSNNRLTPAVGFDVPDEHFDRFAIENEVVGTDPDLTLRTRRGTGYYKIPSLRHAWARGPFGHSGSCATLEDWFDPKRLSEHYSPTGFKRQGVSNRAVPGHEYGLDLSHKDKKSLIAFLNTL